MSTRNFACHLVAGERAKLVCDKLWFAYKQIRLYICPRTVRRYVMEVGAKLFLYIRHYFVVEMNALIRHPMLSHTEGSETFNE
jgi:hypothetical protein